MCMYKDLTFESLPDPRMSDVLRVHMNCLLPLLLLISLHLTSGLRNSSKLIRSIRRSFIDIPERGVGAAGVVKGQSLREWEPKQDLRDYSL